MIASPRKNLEVELFGFDGSTVNHARPDLQPTIFNGPLSRAQDELRRIDRTTYGNGTNQYGTVPNSTDLISSNAVMTMCFKIRIPNGAFTSSSNWDGDYSGWLMLPVLSLLYAPYLMMYSHPAKAFQFLQSADGSTWGTLARGYFSDFPGKDDGEIHYLWAINDGTNAYVYLDDIAGSAPDTSPVSSLVSTAEPLYFNRSFAAGAWQHSTDDTEFIKVWPGRAFSAEERQAFMLGGVRGYHSLFEGSKVLYDFNGDLLDSSGNLKDANSTPSAAPFSVDRFGIPNQAVQSHANKVRSPAIQATDPLSGFAVITPNGISSQGTLIGQCDSSAAAWTSSSWIFYTNINQGFTFNVAGATGWAYLITMPNGSAAPGNRLFLGWRIDGTNRADVFLNGVQYSQIGSTGGLSMNLINQPIGFGVLGASSLRGLNVTPEFFTVNDQLWSDGKFKAMYDLLRKKYIYPYEKAA